MEADMDLENIVLAKGGHADRSNGLCAMEVVALLANLPHSDMPECTDRVIGRFVQCLNDQMSDADRQMLVPYLPKLIGTRGSYALSVKRAFIAADFAVRDAAV